jgi:ketosteroid isomerase-like protein
MAIPADPVAFSEAWAGAWNRRDVEAVLEWFHDDVIFTSPVAERVVPDSRGIIVGKAALRAYWNEALDRVPDLHFRVEGVHEGITSIVIAYRNQKDVLVNEVLIFDGDRVGEGHGTYPAGHKT